ncbi:MAG TPA: methyltransferase domain-containing protein [Gammaproteobacteria bacterium]|nr:methyltransferase domain-containing protein [Gammaproteobacteria bacterium]
MSGAVATQEKWNKIYSSAESVGDAVAVLKENSHLLPAQGQALELACGMGRNALFLARQGLETAAWDISDVAIQRLNEEAKAQNFSAGFHAQIRDVVKEPMLPNSFDVIVVSYFLDRSLMPAIQDALRPGGLLFYQTFSRLQVDESGPRNPDFRLADNELLSLFSQMRLLVYREEGCVGDCEKGFRNEVKMVAQKR